MGNALCFERILTYQIIFTTETALLQTEIDQLEGLAGNMKSDLDELERGRVTRSYRFEEKVIKY